MKSRVGNQKKSAKSVAAKVTELITCSLGGGGGGRGRRGGAEGAVSKGT